MKIVLKLLVIVLSIVITSIAVAEDQKPVGEFALLGIQLGDDAEQAIEGINEYFSLSRDDLAIRTDNAGKNIDKVVYQTDDLLKVEIFLSDRVLNSDNQEIRVVSSVYVRWENNDEFGDTLIDTVEGYSPPSFYLQSSSTRVLWKLCDTLNETKDECGEGSDGMVLNYSTNKGRVTMVRDFRQ